LADCDVELKPGSRFLLARLTDHNQDPALQHVVVVVRTLLLQEEAVVVGQTLLLQEGAVAGKLGAPMAQEAVAEVEQVCTEIYQEMERT